MQSFWVEAIKKEASLRLEWQLKYSKAFAKEAIKRKQERNAAMKKSIAPTVDPHTNIMRHIAKMEDNLVKEKKPGAPLSDTEEAMENKGDDFDDIDLLNFREMRSPSPKTRLQLYDGISHHGEGRYAYLKKRYKKSPEERFDFPVMSSAVYGWKIKNVPKCSPFARTRIIRDTFYRHSGIITG